jgi:hypothetical protein
MHELLEELESAWLRLPDVPLATLIKIASVHTKNETDAELLVELRRITRSKR